jgi:hypothetical protein
MQPSGCTHNPGAYLAGASEKLKSPRTPQCRHSCASGSTHEQSVCRAPPWLALGLPRGGGAPPRPPRRKTWSLQSAQEWLKLAQPNQCPR